jgi:hypothetical protein
MMETAGGSRPPPMSVAAEVIMGMRKTLWKVWGISCCGILGMLGWVAASAPGWSQTRGDGQATDPESTLRRGRRPAFLTRQRQEPIFDRGVEELTPIQRAARELARRHETAKVPTLENIRHLVTYTYDLEGDNEQGILAEARIRSLKAAGARLYFQNFYLLGLDLLEPYLRRNGEAFIARTTIEHRQILPDNRIGLRVTMSVNLDQLYTDLQEKMFLATPELEPIGSVHLMEIVGGRPDAAAGGRARIEGVLEHNRFRVYTNRMAEAMRTADLSTQADLMYEARMEAERNAIEFFISGTMTVRPAPEAQNRQILFDNYSFQEADVVLQLYRVDTGELIAEARDSYSATGPSAEEAVRNTLDVMMPRVAQQLATRLREYWQTTMLDQADYRVMISGVERNQTERVYNWLKTFAPGMRIYEKSFYGNVAVINIDLPETAQGDFAQFLRRSIEPQFEVNEVFRGHILLEAL